MAKARDSVKLKKVSKYLPSQKGLFQAMEHSPSLLWSNLQSLWLFVSFIIVLKVLIPSLTQKWSKKQKPKLPPGPKPWPVVGNLPEMLANKPVHRWIHNLMKQMNTEIACIRLGNTYVIPVTCPTIARQFLSEHDATFASRSLTTCTDLVTTRYIMYSNTKKMLLNHEKCY